MAKSKEELTELKSEYEALNKKLKELSDDELKEVTGGLSVYSDEGTITMYFSASENPSSMIFSIKNRVQEQLGCYFHPNTSTILENLLREMSDSGKTYLKINYTRNGEFITEISVNIMF